MKNIEMIIYYEGEDNVVNVLTTKNSPNSNFTSTPGNRIIRRIRRIIY